MSPKSCAVSDRDFFSITNIFVGNDGHPELTRHPPARKPGRRLTVMIQEFVDVADLSAVNLGDLRFEGKVAPDEFDTPVVAVRVGGR